MPITQEISDMLDIGLKPLQVLSVFCEAFRLFPFIALSIAIIYRMVAQRVHPLNIIPSSDSSATWCIVVSLWCLPTTAYKGWRARYYYRNDKENISF